MDIYAASFYWRQIFTLKLWFQPNELTGYDSIEIWRSSTGAGGPYIELTGPLWSPAHLTTGAIKTKLAGKQLILDISSQVLDMTFTGPDLLTPAQVADQIETAGQGLLQAYVNEAGTVTTQTIQVGCAARLVATEGDAAILLGLSLDTPAYGTDARPIITQAVGYLFDDTWSSKGDFYKTRLHRNADGATSEFSVPFSRNPTRAVEPPQLIRGWVRICDTAGRPVGNKSIMLSGRDTVHTSYVDGLVVDMDDMILVTDEDGYASTTLMRGVRIAVGIAGTSLVRDIIPPVDPAIDSFNLFDPACGDNGNFVVQVPDTDAILERATFRNI